VASFSLASKKHQWEKYLTFTRLFETIWKDRAEKAGWTLDIQYSKDENETCVFHFRRDGEGELKEGKETK